MKPISSKEASKLFRLPYSEEFSAANAPNFDTSIYLGKTREFGIPFFLDFESVFNPHVFVFGMSGSGKSFMLKSLLARLEAFLSTSILIIDLTGEYAEFASLLHFTSLIPPISKRKHGDFFGNLNYLNLSSKSEIEKEKISTRLLEDLLSQARKKGPSSGQRIFVVLDEAWKLLLKGDILDILIREGRKYGIGMVLASQLLGDIKEAFLSNVATIFCFRIQDQPSLERLSKSYSLSERQIDSVRNLEIGNCLVIRVHKDQKIDSFFLGKIPFAGLSKSISIIVRDSMRFEIPQEKFDRFLATLQMDQGKSTYVRGLFEGNYSLELKVLIFELIKIGARKSLILQGMRSLKIDEDSIADAFAAAVQKGE